MNPFRPRTAEPITETDLIAFHLQELSPRREQTVLRAIESSPSLAAELDAIALSLSALKDVPMHIDEKVLDRNWKALRPSLAAYAAPPVRAARWLRRPVFAGALVASAAVLTFVAAIGFVTLKDKPVLFRGTASATLAASSPAPDQAGLSGPPSQSVFAVNPALGISPSSSQPWHSVIQSGAVAPFASVPAFPPALTRQPDPVVPPMPFSAVAQTPSAIASVQKRASAPEPGTIADSGGASPGRLQRPTPRHGFDLMLAMGGTLIAPHTADLAGGVQSKDTASHAVAAIVAIHQQFRPAIGYRVTVSYSRPDFLYSSGNAEELNSRIYEIAGTYVVQGPHRGRLKTSADVGAGLLAFLPTVAAQFPGHVLRAAGVVGVNLDYAIGKHWGARASYRAQIYKSPDFSDSLNSIPSTDSVTFSNEPSLGVTYNFGRK